LISKIGALAFTIILARLLLPELFGLYSLALSTILFFTCFTDFGVGVAVVRFVSKVVGKDKKKAKAYLKYLFKIRIFLTFFSAILLAVLAKLIAENYYNKPIFLALLAGSLYLLLISIITFLDGLFQSTNNFKYPFFKEVIFQILRLLLAPLIILVSLRYAFSANVSLFFIILVLSLCYFLALLFLFFIMKKKIIFLQAKKQNLSKDEKKQVNRFILPLSFMAFAGVVFGYVDIIMLGRFVFSEFIGYYRAAFSLIISAAAILGFAGVAVLPLFSKLKEESLEKAFKKTARISILISVAGAIFTLIFASVIIKIIYGTEYLSAVLILRYFSLLLISLPLTGLYNTYFISRGKTKIIAILSVCATILNIVLNYTFITIGMKYGMMQAIAGAGIATILSGYIYLFGLVVSKFYYNKRHKLI